MKKVAKGNFGYIEYNRKFALIRTIAALAVCIIIFVTGLVIYKSNRNADF